jgi:hypothetical protein
LSRLRIFTIFATLLALATALAACGSSSSSNGENPQKVVNEATLKGIKSGNLNMTLGVKVEGSQGGNLNVSLAGPFQSEGNGQLPQLDISAKANGSLSGKSINFEGGLTLLSEKAYVDYKGTEYEVEPTTFGFVKSAIERNQQSSSAQSKSAGATACQEAASELKVASFVEHLTNEGSADVGGTSTTHVSGELNVPGAVDALIKLTENPACSSQLSAAGQIPATGELDKAKGQLESALKSAHVDLYVGSDHIIRRITLEVSIEPPNGASSGAKKVDLNLDLSINDVNQPQTISAPSGAKPLNELFQQLGVNPIELLGAASGKGGLSGSGGIGSLLNGISGAAGAGTSGSSETGGSSTGGGAAPTGAASQAYQKCLQGVTSPAQLQKCAALLK